MPARMILVYEGVEPVGRMARALTRLCLLLALALAIAPRVAAAEGLLRSEPTASLRPPTRDYAALFRSPASRIGRYPFGSPSLYAAGMSGSSGPGLLLPAGAVCRAALAAAEARYAIPTGLLQAIGMVESGRRDEATGERRPWPWTINIEGEGRFFDTKAQAVTWVRQAQAQGTRSIDTGCAQVNLLHHPAAFASLEQAFDPAANADYAARFLKELRTMAGGNWMTAVGYYHSQTPELAAAYRDQVQAVTSRRAGSTAFAVSFPFAPDRLPPFRSVGRDTSQR
jgi:Transglycosylase SLT domain